MTDTKKIEYTPVTKQPIPSVTPATWADMSLTELWDQRSALTQRLSYAQQMSLVGNNVVGSLQQAIDALDQIIEFKSSKQERIY